MRLYFAGCSHTYGDDLADPENKSWPALAAKNMGCDFVNDSVGGSSNDRIIYRTIKYANQFDRLYIAWTYTTRFTRYRSDNNHEVNFTPSLQHGMYDSDPNFLIYGKMHYAIWHNELYNFKLWLQNIIMLQRYLETSKKEYVMVNADNNHIDKWTAPWEKFNDGIRSLVCFDLLNDDQLYQEHQEIQQLLMQINFDHYIGWNTWWLFKDHAQFLLGPTKHLLDDGHKHIANYILKAQSLQDI
jgi:hypothetical protein